MRSPDLGTAPRVLVTPAFHLLEAWHGPDEAPVPLQLLTVDPAAPDRPRAYFRLILEGPPDDERLRKFPFVPPPAAMLLFVPAEAQAPWDWHRQPGFYFDIRARDRRTIYDKLNQKVMRVIETEALWSACWVHKEFTNHSGDLSDVKIDWLGDRIIDKARRDIERR